jgi:uncharacterized membrane protein YdjX (TVP38/TMEM64 family)
MEIFFNQEAIENFINGLGIWGPVVFFLLQVLQVIIAPIPGNILTMVGGALFGLWTGFWLAYTANIVGSVLGFLIARKAGRAVIAKLIGAEKFNRYMEKIGTESAGARTKILLILVVLLPFLPSDIMCLAAGVTPMSFRAFVIIVITCRPWGQFVAALLGISSYNMPVELLIPFIAGIIIICVTSFYFAPKIENLAIKFSHKIADRFSKSKD